MWEPVGPLPAAVYWRRRCVALASAATMVALVVATAGVHPPMAEPVPAANRSQVGASNTTPADGPTAVDTAPSATEGTPPSATADGSPASSPTPDRTAPATGTASVDGTAPAGAQGGAPVSGGPTASPGASATTDTPLGPFSAAAAPSSSAAPSVGPSAADGTTERIRPDDTPRPSVAAQSPVPVPRTGPVPCTNDMLTATAEIDHAVHRVGSRPVLRLVIANVSGQPCVRDLDASRQEIVVWSEDGVDRLWSSNDCLNAPTVDLRTLVPGRPVAFAVTWAERTTTPGCAQPRTRVPAGSYRLMVRLDDLISAPTPFIRTP